MISGSIRFLAGIMIMMSGGFFADAVVPEAGDTLSADSVTVSTGPVMSFPEGTTLDFGPFRGTKVQTGRIRIRNTGDAPLVIWRVFAECGCTVPKYPHHPRAPGDTASIEVRFDGRTRSRGEFVKGMRLSANDAKKSHILFVKGRIK